MNIYKYLLLISLIFLFSPTITHAVTEFVSIVDTGPSGDYSTLSSWEQYNQCNLLTSRVLSHGGITDTIADDSYVKGAVSGAYGTVVHVTSTQIAIETITGTFQNSEQIDKTDTLNGAISNPAANVTSSSAPDSIISVASCQATTSVADQTAVTIEGWTTSAANYIKVYTTEANRHSGVWDGGKYHLRPSSSNSLTIKESYVEIIGLQIANGFATSQSLIYSNGANYVGILIDKCIFDGEGNTDYGFYLGSTSDSSSWIIRNTIIYNMTDRGIYEYYSSDTAIDVYNCVIFDCGEGVREGYGTVTCKNCVAFNNSDDFYSVTTIDYCASDDGDGTNAVHWTNGSTDWGNVFTDYANGDFHLNNFTGTGTIIDQGDDLTAEGFSDDIDGQTRPQQASTYWDIGADEAAEQIYRSVGPSASSAIDSNSSPGTNTIAITSGAAAFAEATATNVGVGDVILYDSNDSGTLTSADSIAFIKSRTDNQNYVIQTETGATPSDMPTPNDTWAIYRAYTSLSNAESGTKNTSIPISFTGGNRDLVTNNEQWNIACYNGQGDAADQTTVSINGWTTGENNYIKVYTPTETTEVGTTQRHSGVWDEGKYRLVPNGDFNSIVIEENFTKIEGLQIITYDAVNRIPLDINANEVDVSYCILRGTNNTGQSGIDARSSTGPYYFWNNIIYDLPSRGIYADISGNAYVYNNTVYNCGEGIRTAWHDIIAKNNITQFCTDGYFGTFDSSSDYNISDVSQADADSANPGGVFDGYKTVTFIDSGGSPPDFHLNSTDTAAKDAGTDSVSPINFFDDIDSDSRPSDVGEWDIGADEVMPPTVINFSNTSTINSSQTSKMTDGLVLMQSFDGNHMDWNESAAEARDQSGEDNHGDVVGATAAIGKIGQGLEFDGSTDYVEVNDADELDITGNITISAWIKANSLTIGSDENRVVLKGAGAHSQNLYTLDIYGTSVANQHISFLLHASSYLSSYAIGSTNIQLDTWYSITGTYDGAVTRVYLNGVEDGYKNYVGTGTANANPVQIGRRKDISTADQFDGTIDEVRIYNRALSSDEVGDLYRMGRVTFRK